MATSPLVDSRAYVRRKITVGSSKTAGSVEIISEMPVYLEEDSDSNNQATCILPGCMIVELAVKGENAGGNNAVALGDKIYKDSTVYNKDASNGVLFGYALEAVSSGATTTIEVLAFVN